MIQQPTEKFLSDVKGLPTKQVQVQFKKFRSRMARLEKRRKLAIALAFEIEREQNKLSPKVQALSVLLTVRKQQTAFLN